MPCKSEGFGDEFVRSLKLFGRRVNATTSRAHAEQSALIDDDSQIRQKTDLVRGVDGWARYGGEIGRRDADPGPGRRGEG